MKTTSNERRPKNIRSEISQLKLRLPNHILQILKMKMDPMEDDLRWKDDNKACRM